MATVRGRIGCLLRWVGYYYYWRCTGVDSGAGGIGATSREERGVSGSVLLISQSNVELAHVHVRIHNTYM